MDKKFTTEITSLPQISRLKDGDFISVLVGNCPMYIDFKDFIKQVHETEPPVLKDEYTLIINPTPGDAIVQIDGIEQSTITAAAGSIVNYLVTAAGYHYQSGSFVMDRDATIDVHLLEISDNVFPFVFGEIGYIGAANPSLMTQETFDLARESADPQTLIEAPVEDFIPEENSAVPSGRNGAWWIAMVPSGKVDLSQYKWLGHDEFTGEFTELEPVSGTVTLDGITWAYSAARPLFSTQMKFKKIN